MCSVCGHREHRNESLRPLRRRRLVVRPQQGKALVHAWGINHTGQVPSQYLKFPISALIVQVKAIKMSEAKDTLKKRRHHEMFSGLCSYLNERGQLAAGNPLEYYQG